MRRKPPRKNEYKSWYRILRISQSYYANDLGNKEFTYWMRKNINGRYKTETDWFGGRSIYFENEDDYVLYKFTWV